jgi:hypothetical protein
MVLLSLLATTDALSIGLRPPSVPASAHRAHIAMRGTLPDHANVPRGLVSMNLFQNLAQMRDQRVAGISHINLAPGKCTLPLPEAVDLMKRWKEEIADDPDRFAERAASDSQCPTAGAGGSLGFVTRGKLSKQFDDIIFGHEPGRVYGPITTPAGEPASLVVPRPRHSTCSSR